MSCGHLGAGDFDTTGKTLKDDLRDGGGHVCAGYPAGSPVDLQSPASNKASTKWDFRIRSVAGIILTLVIGILLGLWLANKLVEWCLRGWW